MQSKNNPNLKILIVDDEPLACNNLKNIIHGHVDPSLQIAAIVHNTHDALTQIRLHQPDALFLDIEMPEEDAFHFLERIHPFPFEVVFVTAFDAYAVKAFKLNAIDYIMKPVSIAEVQQAVARLKEKIAYKRILHSHSEGYRELAAQMVHKKQPQKIFLKEQNAITPVNFADICYVEAKGSYATIHFKQGAADRQIIMSHSIAEYEEILPQDTFFRIHKSYLINGQHLKSIVKGDNAMVVVTGGHSLPVGRRRYADLLAFVKSFEVNLK